MDRDGDLAVGQLAQRAAILIPRADGVLALLGKADIVDDKALRPQVGRRAMTAR